MREENDIADSRSSAPPPIWDEDRKAADFAPERARAAFDGFRSWLSQGGGKWIGGFASLALFSLAIFTLAHTFSQIDFSKVRQALAAISGVEILQAFALTALSYLALTGYDALALWQLKTRVGYKLVALASFASYAFSFNLGFPIVTGAAARYWVYSRQRVSALQVANITIISGATFWLGMTATFGMGMIIRAEAVSVVDRLPAFLNFLIGAATLGGVIAYCVWTAIETRRIRIREHLFELPGLLPTLGQIVLGVADLCCAAGALYVILPEGVDLDFTTFVLIYVFACILGVISHSPGGLGVFEATMLHAVPFDAQEGLLASLLLFRVIYYFIPFIAALALLGADEVARRWSALKDAISKIMETRE
jgi:glycosyltransferase 2 family protein